METRPEDTIRQQIAAAHASQTIAALKTAREALFAQLGAEVFADAASDPQLRDRYEMLMGRLETISALIDSFGEPQLEDASAGEEAAEELVEGAAADEDVPDEAEPAEEAAAAGDLDEDLPVEVAPAAGDLDEDLPAVDASGEVASVEVAPAEVWEEAEPLEEAPASSLVDADVPASDAPAESPSAEPWDAAELTSIDPYAAEQEAPDELPDKASTAASLLASHEPAAPTAALSPEQELEALISAVEASLRREDALPSEPLSSGDAEGQAIDFSWFEEHALRDAANPAEAPAPAESEDRPSEPATSADEPDADPFAAFANPTPWATSESSEAPEPPAESEPLELTTLLPNASAPESASAPEPVAARADDPKPAAATNVPAAQGQLVCSKCGAPLKPNNKFCGNCGERVSPAQPSTTPEPQATPHTCPHCGEPVGAHDAFCMMCGTKLSGSAPVRQLRPKPRPHAQPKDRHHKGLRCPHCHEPILPGDVFCQACGTRL